MYHHTSYITLGRNPAIVLLESRESKSWSMELLCSEYEVCIFVTNEQFWTLWLLQNIIIWYGWMDADIIIIGRFLHNCVPRSYTRTFGQGIYLIVMLFYCWPISFAQNLEMFYLKQLHLTLYLAKILCQELCIACTHTCTFPLFDIEYYGSLHQTK